MVGYGGCLKKGKQKQKEDICMTLCFEAVRIGNVFMAQLF